MTSKSKTLRLCVAMLLVLCSLVGCIHLDEPPEGKTEETSGLPPQESVAVKHYYETTVYTYATEVDEEILKTGLGETWLLLVNKTAPLGENYVPADCVLLPSAWTTRTMSMEGRAAMALGEMMEEMEAAGVKNIYVTSAYRSYVYQNDLFERYKAKEMNDISNEAYSVLGYEYIYNKYLVNHLTRLDPGDAERVVLTYSAMPGTSEHQTGLCVDFITEEMGGNLDVSFENYEAFTWLSQNAYRFGFILRYPKDKTEITGYQYEPWHYRFVGREAATDIYFSGLTLEEYLSLIE